MLKEAFNTGVLAEIQHEMFIYEYSFINHTLIYAAWCMYPVVY